MLEMAVVEHLACDKELGVTVWTGLTFIFIFLL